MREEVMKVTEEMKSFMQTGKADKEVVTFQLEGADAIQYRFFRAIIADEKKEKALAASLVCEGLVAFTKEMMRRLMMDVIKGGGEIK